MTFILTLACALLLALLIAATLFLHRRKKIAARGAFDLMGAGGRVEKSLQPVGVVIVRGEMWPASSRAGELIACGAQVRVVGANGHRLLVEPLN